MVEVCATNPTGLRLEFLGKKKTPFGVYLQRSSNRFCADRSIAIKVPEGDLSHNEVN